MKTIDILYQIFDKFNLVTQARLANLSWDLYTLYKKNLTNNVKKKSEVLLKKITNKNLQIGLPDFQIAIPDFRRIETNINDLFKFLMQIKYDKIKNIPFIDSNLNKYIMFYYLNLGYPLVTTKQSQLVNLSKGTNNFYECHIDIVQYNYDCDFVRNIVFLPKDKDLNFEYTLYWGSTTLYKGSKLPKNILEPFILTGATSYQNLTLRIRTSIPTGKGDLKGPRGENIQGGWLFYDKGFLTNSLRDNLFGYTRSNALYLKLQCCSISNMLNCTNSSCLYIIERQGSKIFIRSKEEREQFQKYYELGDIFGPLYYPKIHNNGIIIKQGCTRMLYI